MTVPKFLASAESSLKEGMEDELSGGGEEEARQKPLRFQPRSGFYLESMIWQIANPPE